MENIIYLIGCFSVGYFTSKIVNFLLKPFFNDRKYCDIISLVISFVIVALILYQL